MVAQRKLVPVVDVSGKVIGQVSSQATSIAAARIAKAPVVYRRIELGYCWQEKR